MKLKIGILTIVNLIAFIALLYMFDIFGVVNYYTLMRNKIAPNESSLPQPPAEDEKYYDTNISTLYWYTDPVFNIIKGDNNYTTRAYNRVEDLIQAIHTNGGNLPESTNASSLSSSLMQVLGNQLKAWGFTYKHLDLSKEAFKQYVIDVIFVTNKAEGQKLINEWNQVK